MKKLIALVLALVMVLMVGAALADDQVTIQITRDDTYAGNTATAGNTYTAYKVFSATYSSNTSTGGDYDSDGTPGDISGTASSVAYIASSTVAAKLGEWKQAVGTAGEAGYVAAHWEKKTDNKWFDLTPIAGTNPTQYSVSWANSIRTSDEAQKAAQWLLDNAVYEGNAINLTFSNGKWSADVTKGYYLVVSAIGANLIAATTDIDVSEKNAYPPVVKTQADEDASAQTTNDVDVAIGDEINYEVSVTIPATAKVGDRILVWDKATNGLTYKQNSLKVKDGTNTKNATIADPDSSDVDANWTWSKLITVTDESQGTEIVFQFTMTVNSNALVDEGKKNESGVKYGNASNWKYDSLPVKVEYKTYYAGLHKYDGTNTTTNLKGVKFELTENGTAFNVTKGSDGVYTPGGNSNEVITDDDGKIYIRGLDDDKEYLLTETQALPGYNPLPNPIKLTLHLDTYKKEVNGQTVTETTSFQKTATDKWSEVANNKGTLLPSTGGIGTTIFYILGGLLVVGAAVILVARRKAHD